MPEQNAATSGANNTEGTTNAGTANGANNQAGAGSGDATTQNNAATTDAQTGATGKVAFTPEQQSWINSKIADEKKKAIEAANKKAAEEKDLSEKEKAEKRATEAESALFERDKRDSFKTAIASAKVLDADALYKLVGGELEFENDKFKNLTKVLDGAKVSFPYLFPTASGSADAGKKDDVTAPESKPGVDRIRNAYATAEKSKT